MPGCIFLQIKVMQINAKKKEDATQAQLCSLRTIYLDRAVWYSMCRSYCAGTRGAVIVFNEGPLYRFSAGHPPLNGQNSKAFTLFKIPHLSASTPMHHSSLHCWVKTMQKELEQDCLPGILSLLTAQRLLWGDTNQNEIFATEIKCPT